jgi:hypothetical protein
MLDAYVADYQKEEVAAEGLVRNLPTFSQCLDFGGFGAGISSERGGKGSVCGPAGSRPPPETPIDHIAGSFSPGDDAASFDAVSLSGRCM